MRTRLLTFAVLVAAVATVLVVTGGAGARSAATVELVAKLKGIGEVPAAPASNTGRAELKLNSATGRVCWVFSITKIDGKANAAHIHKGAKGVSGPVKVPLGTAFKRTGCTKAAKALVRSILAKPGAFYVNVHNAKHPAGALRGQLTK
jgi:CHRD domain-containing protein